MHWEESLESLRSSYCSTHTDDELNTAFRSALVSYAESDNIDLLTDNVGNIYLSRPGTDTTLANIAIVFPLDCAASADAFEAPFRLFHRLASRDLECSITLMGYTSVQKQDIGYEIWEKSITGSGSSSSLPSALKQFSSQPSPSNFTFSAAFRVTDTDTPGLVLQGSAVLVGKAQSHTGGHDEVVKQQTKSTRAPYLSVSGNSAGVVVEETICDYSKYVADMWDNF